MPNICGWICSVSGLLIRLSLSSAIAMGKGKAKGGTCTCLDGDVELFGDDIASEEETTGCP